MSKLIFKDAAWDDGMCVVTARPDWEKNWRSAPIGGVIDRDTAIRIAKWLNQGGYKELETIFKNGYENPVQLVSQEEIDGN